MRLYQYNPQIPSTYKEQSRIIGNIIKNVRNCIEENNFKFILADFGHKTCEYHFQNPSRKDVRIKTELNREPLHAALYLIGDETKIKSMTELIKIQRPLHF